MLANAKLQTVICTTQIALATSFYQDKLGLKLIKKDDGASVFDVSGSEIRLSPVPSHTPPEHTIAGFAVTNLDQCIEEFADREISLERFAVMPHDSEGVVTTPDGSRVVWFRDPDGNLLSVVQYPS